MSQWSKVYRSQIVTAGDRSCLTLGFPARGRLNRLLVTQVSPGAAPNFELRVYASKRPCEGGSGSSAGPNDDDGTPEAAPEAYLVLPPQNGVAGSLALHYETGYAYENLDGTPSSREYKIYLEFRIPSGTGQVAYDITLGCETPG